MRTLLKQVLRVSFVTFASVNYKSQIKLNELHLPSPYVRAAPGSEEAWIKLTSRTWQRRSGQTIYSFKKNSVYCFFSFTDKFNANNSKKDKK